MLSQEEYMDLLALQRQGKTFKEIGEELGYHPATIAKWVKDGGPPAKREIDPELLVIDARWRARIVALLEAAPALLGTSVFDMLGLEGFEGSYASVVRELRAIRGPRFKTATVSVPIETAPGEEAQFDWSDCTSWARDWGWECRLWCFGAILAWARRRFWWFTTTDDRQHTFEALVRALEHFAGVPKVLRTDRMGTLGASKGHRFTAYPPTVEFARHHGVELVVCRAGDAKRKGKVERPFRHLKESFLAELAVAGPPADLAELNARAMVWLARRVDPVAHRSTGVAPAERWQAERSMLAPLPAVRFDTDYLDVRRVHRNLPLVEYRGVRYSVPPMCCGQMVEVRRPVDTAAITIRWAGRLVASHHLVDGVREVWDIKHRAAAEAIAMGRHLHAVPDPPAPVAAVEPVVVLGLGDGDFDVAAVDLGRYETPCDCFGSRP